MGNGDDDDLYYNINSSATVDPAPWAMIVVVVYCTLLILLLPLVIALAQQCKKFRKKRRNGSGTSATTTGDNQTNKELDVVLLSDADNQDDPGDELASSLCYCPMNDTTTNNNKKNKNKNKNKKNKDTAALYGYETNNGVDMVYADDQPQRISTPTSSSSSSRTKRMRIPTTATMGSIFSGIGRPNMSNRRIGRRTRSNVSHLRQPSLFQGGDASFDDSFGHKEDDNGFDHSFYRADTFEDEFDEQGTHSHLKVSNQDTSWKVELDRYRSGLSAPIQSSQQQKQSQKPIQDLPKITVFCGSRPWYKYYCSFGCWNKLKKTASHDKEMKKLLKLTLPFMAHAVLADIFGFLELIVISRMLSSSRDGGGNENDGALVAYFAAYFVLTLSTMPINGALSSLTVLCGQAIGANHWKLAGNYVQIAVLCHHVLFIPLLLYWWNNFDKIMDWLDFEDGDEGGRIEMAVDYARWVFLYELIGVYDTGLYYLLEVSGHEYYTSTLSVIGGLVSLIGSFLIALLVPNVSLWMIGAWHVGLCLLFLVLNVSIILYCQWFPRDVWVGIFGSIPRYSTVRTFFQTSIPLSLGYILEYSEWEILFVFAAAQGSVELEAWGLLGEVWGIAEDISMAVASATEVRVSQLLGQSRPDMARYTAHKSVLVALVTTSAMSIVIMLLKNVIPIWLTREVAIQQLVGNLLPMMSFGLVGLAIGTLSWSILCAQGRVSLGTFNCFLGSALCTLPLASISTFVFNFNIQGLLATVIIGYATAGALNTVYMVNSNWVKLSEKTAKRTKKKSKKKKKKLDGGDDVIGGYKSPIGLIEEEEDDDDEFSCTSETASVSCMEYDDYNWDQLPESIKEAAGLLGYTKEAWDGDQVPDECDLYWSELSAGQQDAAKLLGYTQVVWDKALEKERRGDYDYKGPAYMEYDDYEWEDLPEEIQEAARRLGYTSKTWDGEESPKECDCSWNELSPEKQHAAEILGYNELLWGKPSAFEI